MNTAGLRGTWDTAAPVDLHKTNGHKVKRRGLPRVEPKLIPHSPEAEAGALGCVLLAGEMGQKSEVERLMMKLRPEMFFVHQNKVIHDAIALMLMHEKTVNIVCLRHWLEHTKVLPNAGGLEYIAHLTEMTPSIHNFESYQKILVEERCRRRAIEIGNDLVKDASSGALTEDDLKRRTERLFDMTRSSPNAGRIKVWTAKELNAYEPPEKVKLIGDNEINTGYEGITVVAGPGSSGKSLCSTSLALAGAIGSGVWMGRKVHRQFKTLIIQAENGATRLKSELSLLQKNHPKVDINGHIFVTSPPEGGLPFHKAEFRAEVRRSIEQIKPDLVTLDPWSHIAAEDAAKDVVDKLAEIRSCFPGGDDCPGLLIVAHTSKPRSDTVRTGRGLAYLVSGSVALVNTARCVYVLLPWSDDPVETRVLWTCAKLNNGQMYPSSVWHRRVGTFFDHDEDTNPQTWGQTEGDDDRKRVTQDQLKAVFAKLGRPGVKKGELAAALSKHLEVGTSTAYRIISEGGYLHPFLIEAAGVLALRKEQNP